MSIAVLLATVLVSPQAQPVPQSPAPNPLAALGITIVQPMSEAETAATRAGVDALLAQQGLSERFTNTTSPTGGEVTHTLSGMRCPLGKPDQSVTMRGQEEIICASRNGETAYETRMRNTNPRQPDAQVYDDIQRRLMGEPGWRAYTGPVVQARGGQLHHTWRFISRVDGVQRYSHVMAGIVRGYILTERATGPVPERGATNMSEVLIESTFGSRMQPVRPAGGR